VEIHTEGTIGTEPQPTQALTQQHGGTTKIAPLTMKVGHGDLEDALENGALGLQGFMPEGLKAIVTGIPVALVELIDCFLKAGIPGQCLFALALGRGGMEVSPGDGVQSVSAWRVCAREACAGGWNRG